MGEVLDAAQQRYGQTFTDLLPRCRVWVNGEPASSETPIKATDEVAVLPPVSGG